MLRVANKEYLQAEDYIMNSSSVFPSLSSEELCDSNDNASYLSKKNLIMEKEYCTLEYNAIHFLTISSNIFQFHVVLVS